VCVIRVNVRVIMRDGSVFAAGCRYLYICGGMWYVVVTGTNLWAFNVVQCNKCEDMKGSSAGRDGHNQVHADKTEK